jgi:hypothetical protein
MAEILTLRPGDILFYPLPLPRKPLQSMDFSRRQVDLIQFFPVDERHFGQGKGIETISFDGPRRYRRRAATFCVLAFTSRQSGCRDRK